ncbi:hypothetical protein KSL4_1229 [Leuconostoc inhae]|uniref:Uncharacterized protein n=1 Tax=Leuconostoc inhae TaxID=178001 RepID=A0ABM9V0V4_9LACO|nr:hypothetical protein KSL4_1229 [Leuconostoc inhae]
MLIDFTLVLIVGFIIAINGFILMLCGTIWIKPWGKQYKITNGKRFSLGLILLALDCIFVLWQVILKQ